MNYRHWHSFKQSANGGRKHWLQALALSCLSTIFTAMPAFGAERISFSSGWGEFSISVASLDAYARTGKKDNELAFYAQHIKPQELVQLRKILQYRIKLSSVTVAQFLYSSMGVKMLQFLGDLVKMDSQQNGFYALRSALILAAADKQGITALEVIKKFPSPTIRINSTLAFEIVGAFDQLIDKTDKVTALVEQQSQIEATASSPVNPTQPLDLQQPGKVQWHKQTLVFHDRIRSRSLKADLYLPQLPTPAPVLVISHGVGSDRTDFADLAQHLASHGFAVASLEHPGSNGQQLQSLFQGTAKEVVETEEFINRPKDVSYLLDELERLSQSHPRMQGRLNLQQVGMLGHSFGGYTALALAGAQLNFEQLEQECRVDNSNLNAANVSLLLQCLALNLPDKTSYHLQDKRIQAVLAMKPFSSGIFGQKGLRQIQVPVMLIAGSNDVVTPAVVEQICPFSWLSSSDKYLVLMQNGTHVFDNQEFANRTFPIPGQLAHPHPALARRYLKAMSLAFAKTYVAGQLQYREYLNPSYIKALSQPPLPLFLVRSLTTTQLSQTQNLSCPGSQNFSSPEKPKIQNLE
ncbi:alpha/beta hydrolase [Scytonema tolypothrichoides VB-61278]|nr:alpha/beta hydrolase [Scytonema tolypothrichoides VB-61278]